MAFATLGKLSRIIAYTHQGVRERMAPPRVTGSTVPACELSRAATLSLAAYKERDDFVSIIRNMAKKEIVENRVHFIDAALSKKSSIQQDTQVYVWFEDRVAHVVFRGTEDARDMLADVDVRQHTMVDGCRVHHGFMTQFMAVRDELDRLLYAHEGAFDEVVVTGHSLGAALATIASLEYARLFSTKFVRCYTFGSPRVGDSRFAGQFNEHVSEHWRVFHEHDPVSMIPISPRYEHVGGLSLRLDNDDDNRFSVFKNDIAWLWRVPLSLLSLNYLNVVEPHNIRGYVARMMLMREPKAGA